MIILPNAKINLGLSVVERRPDGYHNLETVFYPIPLHDMLEVVLTDGPEPYRFSSSGLAIAGDPEKNICVKAYRRVSERYPIPPIGICLHKMVPMGAGLGGGSADGAYMVRLLNDMFDLKMTDDEMRRMVAPIGADCPFFVDARPAYATGIGDRLEPVGLDLGGWWLTLVKPDIFVSTAEAYRGVTPDRPRHSVRDVVGLPVAEWRGRLVNDFEQTVFALHPEIAGIKRKLYECGCVYAAMSGSGSSVFGLSAQQIDADFPDCFVWSGKL